MGLISNPPSPPPDYPGVSVPDYTSQAQQVTAGMQAAGWFDAFWKAHFEHKLPGLQSVVNIAGSVIDDIFALGLGLIGTLQAQGTPGFFTLLAEALADLTGVEFSSSQMQSAWGAGGALGANENIGGQFLTMLSGELQSGVKLPQGPGVSAASAWLGYGLNFAIREANIAMLVEFLPEEIRFMEGLREYGVAVADALGLGRLTRLVMTPFLKVLVQDPLTYDLNTAYTPTMLSAAEYLRANWRGQIDAGTLNTALAKLGYSPQVIQALMVEAATMPDAMSYVNQARVKYIDSNTLGDGLALVGIPPTVQPSYLQGVEAGRSAAHLDAVISLYVSLVKNRWMAPDVAQQFLLNLGLSAAEVQWALYPAAIALENTQAELSVSDLQSAYEQGLIDISYYAAWLARHGYSLSDQAVMQYLLLLKVQKGVSADQLAVWKLRISCLDAVSKGQPPPPGWDSSCNPPG